MLGLPFATELNKQLPKKAIYAKFQMNNVEKAKIDADISRISIVNEIAPNKVNIAPGEAVKSFYVVSVALKRRDFAEKTIATLSKIIPQNILFILSYEREAKLGVYRQKLMQTEWAAADSLRIDLQGLDLDKVWENIIVQIGGIQITGSNTLDEQIIMDDQKAKLQKEIERLEKQKRAEKQPKKKFALAQQITRLMSEMEGL